MRDAAASFEYRKNELNSGGMANLYEVEVQQAINATPAAYEYWAEYNATVSYFKPGTASAQNYTPALIRRTAIETDNESTVPSMTVNIGAVSQEITAYIENADALRRHRVRVVSVPVDELCCASAGFVDTFYIDGCTLNHAEEIAEFYLTSKGQVSQVTVPLRRYRRSYCYKRYNGSDCRASSVPASQIMAPFADRKCRRTKDDCASKGNLINFGGFPGIGRKRLSNRY